MQLVLSTVLACLSVVLAAPLHLSASRLLQFDTITSAQSDDEDTEPRAPTVTSYGAAAIGLAGQLGDEVALVRWSTCGKQCWDTIESATTTKGVLVILDAQRDADKEREISQRQWSFPIYFVLSTPEIERIYSEVTSHHQRHYLSSSKSGLAAKLDSIPLANIRAFLQGTDQSKAIAIVSNYDPLGTATGLGFGADLRASGPAVLLELARLFAQLYDTPGSLGGHSLLFVLTGGSRLNFYGTRHWLSTADPRILDTIEFALCLDALGGEGDNLYMHLSRNPAKAPVLRQLIDLFETQTQALGIGFEVKQKAINISDPLVYWEHEQFSRKKILAATLSKQSSAPAPGLSRALLFDRVEDINLGPGASGASLVNVVRAVANTLAQYIFKIPKDAAPNAFDFFPQISPSSLLVHLTMLTHPPVNPFKQAPLATELHHALSSLNSNPRQPLLETSVTNFFTTTSAGPSGGSGAGNSAASANSLFNQRYDVTLYSETSVDMVIYANSGFWEEWIISGVAAAVVAVLWVVVGSTSL